MKEFLKVSFLVALIVLFTSLAVYETPIAEKTVTATFAINAKSFQVVEIPLYIQRADILAALFTQPFEIVLFMTNELKMYMYSNELESAVFIGNIVELFETEGVEISEIAFCIHNHLTPGRFSPADTKMYQRLKDNGFTGKFGIYYPFTGTVIYYEPDK